MPALPRLSVISAALICAVMLSGCSEESKMIDLVKNSRSQLDGLEMGLGTVRNTLLKPTLF